MKLKMLVAAFVLVGCGGPSFTVGFGENEADGGPEATGGKVGSGGSEASGGSSSGGTPSSGGSGGATGGAAGSGVVDAGGTASGGSSGSTGGTVATGGQGGAPVEVCCVFPLTSGTTVSPCDTDNPWLCVGAQTFSCAQAGQCTRGMTCYTSGGLYGGTVVPAAIIHDNGLGQTWQDCMPLGTYSEAQAMKACKASSAVRCEPSTRCGPTVLEVQGFKSDGYVLAEWGYGDRAIGSVSLDNNLCNLDVSDKRQWR